MQTKDKKIPPAKDIRLITLDMDGTLLNSDKQLTDRNRRALEAAAEAGIEIVPATGRFYMGLPEAVRSLPFIRYCIIVNGAQVVDIKTGKIIYSADISPEDAIAFYTYLDTLPVIYDCYIDGWGYMTRWMQEAAGDYISYIHSLKMVRELRKPVPELKAYIREGQYRLQKMQLFTKNDVPYRDRLLQELSARYPQYSVTTSLPNNIEVNSRDADKGIAMTALTKYLGLDNSRAMAFGDGLNDVAILRAAGYGVAMDGGHPAAWAAADIHTADCDSDGVALVIEEMLAKA